MRKGTIQKIEEEINEKRKMPKEVKESLRKEIFTNIIICACLVAYFLFLFLGSVDKTKAVRVIDLKIFSTIYLATSIILFEVAYKKDSDEIALNGIEFLVLAIFSLLIQYIPKILKIDENMYMIAGTYIFLIYYGIKNVVIYTCERKNELDNLSDIKEIVKDEPIKKETKRKNKTEE